jgi:hypothetical protein
VTADEADRKGQIAGASCTLGDFTLVEVARSRFDEDRQDLLEGLDGRFLLREKLLRDESTESGERCLPPYAVGWNWRSPASRSMPRS